MTNHDELRRKIILHDDDEVQVGPRGLTTSGKVLRLLSEDMFGWTVHQYIRDAKLGARIRLWQREMDKQDQEDIRLP